MCDIRWILRLRFFCGYYHEIHPSQFIIILARLYCIIITGLHCSFVFTIEMPLTVKIPLLAQYMWCFVTSLIFKDKFLLNYYDFNHLIDKAGCPKYKKLLLYIHIYIFLLFLVRFIYYLLLLYMNYLYDLVNDPLEMLVVKVSFPFITDIGASQCHLIYGLLFLRVRLFRENIKENGFGNAWKNSLNTSYVHMYSSLCDGFNEGNNSIKYLVSDLIIYSFSNFYNNYHKHWCFFCATFFKFYNFIITNNLWSAIKIKINYN